MAKYIEKFESVSKMADALKDKQAAATWKGYYETRQRAATYSEWHGDSFEGAFEKLQFGDAESAAKIKAQGDILNRENRGAKPQMINAVVGCVPNVPNFLRGVPTQMIQVKREPKKNPVIDVYVDTGIWDGCDLDEAAMAAAKIASVITATENAGVRVNLYAIMGVQKDLQNHACVMVKIKESSAPLNLLNIAFPLLNRAFCRVVGLHWLECTITRKYWSGHGRVMNGSVVKREFELNGLVLSMRDTILNNISVEELAKKINEHIAQGRG